MENTEVVEREYEPKPGFALVKYGNVFTFNFNNEFAQRLKNILADFHKNNALKEPILDFFKSLSDLMNLPAGELVEHDLYIIDRYEHVYTCICEREFAQSL